MPQIDRRAAVLAALSGLLVAGAAYLLIHQSTPGQPAAQEFEQGLAAARTPPPDGEALEDERLTGDANEAGYRWAERRPRIRADCPSYSSTTAAQASSRTSRARNRPPNLEICDRNSKSFSVRVAQGDCGRRKDQTGDTPMRLATSKAPFENLGLGAALERWLRPAVGFEHPIDVLKDPMLDLAEKRAILSSWASDASAVQDEPALRWLLGTPSPVEFTEVREALSRLDRIEQTAPRSDDSLSSALLLW